MTTLLSSSLPDELLAQLEAATNFQYLKKIIEKRLALI